MGKLLSGADIVNQTTLDEINLLYQIKTKNILALDSNTFKPIDWEKLENDFREIEALARAPFETHQTSLQNVQKYDEIRGHYTTAQRIQKPVSVNRIKREKDAQRVSWKVLLQDLQDGKVQIIIPESQWTEIVDGWGCNIMKEYALTACYREEELQPYTTSNHAERQSLLLDILLELTPDDYPEDLDPRERKGITQRLEHIKGQMMKGYELCAHIIIEAANAGDSDREWKTFTRAEVEKIAKKYFDVNTDIARKIHSLLPARAKRH